MTAYAEGTKVPIEKSMDEIKRTLDRYGATGWAMGQEDGLAAVMFTAHGRRVRFVLREPDPSDPAFKKTATGQRRTIPQAQAAYLGELRRVWRALALAIKAKLEVVATGIVSFDDEFAMHVILPDNTTVADHVGPAIAEAYETGTVPALLPVFNRKQIEP